ncbi:MAG: hypothetical protein H0W25_18540, partial [Acidimicrobiia bacterium]|nr:hypothetical protein [Acidimicrobiia bacterium]
RRARELAAQVATRLRAPGADAPVVAFLTPRDWAAHVQWEAVIGQALRVRGADVRFITCGGGLEICDRANTWEAPPMPCTSCSGYVGRSLRAHGFAPQELAEGWEGDDGGAWPELDAMTVGDLVGARDGTLPLGALVDIPVKWFLMSATLEDDPLAGLTNRAFLRSARRIARSLDAALDRMAPDVVVLCNGFFLFEAICWELCRQKGIDVVTYERAMIKETLIFRRGGPACLFDLGDAWDTWKDVPLTTDEAAVLDSYLADRQLGLQTIDRYWKDPRFVAPDRTGAGRMVGLFTNLTWDSAVIGQQVAFPSIQHWVRAAIEWFAEHPEHELVVRIHPAEVKLPGKQTREPLEPHIRAAFPTLPANVRVLSADDPTSSYPLMAACDGGLVFTSTTGLELAIAGKPVIVAGQSHYRGRSFTVDAEGPEDFAAKLAAVVADPAAFAPDPELVRRYAYLFFFRAPVKVSWVEEHVLGLARINIRDIDELASGRDPELDRVCDLVLGSHEVA